MGTIFRCSHGCYLFPVLAQILVFSDPDTDSTIFCYSSGKFFGTRPDSTFSRYSPGYYRFQLLTLILPFFGTRGNSFSVLARILPFLVLARILAFSGTDTDSTIFPYSWGLFFGTRTDSTFSRYSPGFYRFQLLTLILPFFGTRRHSFSLLARILPFPGTRPDSTILDRKSTRLNSSHLGISYAVFCLKKKNFPIFGEI